MPTKLGRHAACGLNGWAVVPCPFQIALGGALPNFWNIDRSTAYSGMFFPGTVELDMRAGVTYSFIVQGHASDLQVRPYFAR